MGYMIIFLPGFSLNLVPEVVGDMEGSRLDEDTVSFRSLSPLPLCPLPFVFDIPPNKNNNGNTGNTEGE